MMLKEKSIFEINATNYLLIINIGIIILINNRKNNFYYWLSNWYLHFIVCESSKSFLYILYDSLFPLYDKLSKYNINIKIFIKLSFILEGMI
jgi:hypothetical protein